MPETLRPGPTERALLLMLRLSIGWVFLWAAIHHYGDASYVAGFLSHTKTFHPIYGALAQSAFLPVIAVLVEYGHLLIGLSLISGLLVKASAPFGAAMMLLYWTAHMDYPYIDTINNLMIDEHVVYALLLGYLIVRRAGHVWGLDGWASRLLTVRAHPGLRWLTA
ncbi:MAG TPA: DoxX family protein [Candidatus Sulfotelmatobacter sp.]|nr:DoxX family protein [Candidatus Sulfotelmatobacter sp.]